MPSRKPRPELVDRAAVEAMIAEAVAAERERSEKAVAAVLQALGGTVQGVEGMATALLEAERMIDVHSSLLRPLCDAFAAATEMTEAAAAADATVN